jgi:hypothetical protein
MNLRKPMLYALLLGAVTAAPAATVWDEAVSGDLANSGLAPTAVTLGLGSNVVTGTTGRTGGVVDRDYLTVTLADGWQLESITVRPGTTFLGASGLGFMAVQAGPQVTVSPTGGSAAGLLGWVHYSENDIDSDILGLMGIGPGATGFAGALPAGTYSFWVQDTGTGTAGYVFELAVAAVPEAPMLALWLAGGAALALRVASSCPERGSPERPRGHARRGRLRLQGADNATP